MTLYDADNLENLTQQDLEKAYQNICCSINISKEDAITQKQNIRLIELYCVREKILAEIQKRDSEKLEILSP